MHHGEDLTQSVQTGLAWFYLLACLANAGYGLYQQRTAGRSRQALSWYVVAAVFLLLSGLYFAGVPLELPHWIRDLSDYGLARSFVTLGLTGPANYWIVTILTWMLWLIVAVMAIDVIASYVVGGGARQFSDQASRPLFRNLQTHERIVTWFVIITVFSLILFGLNAISFFILSVVAFAAFVVWRRTLTEPVVVWGILNFSILFGGFSMTDWDFRQIISKPDNVPIVGAVFIVGFFTWLAMRRGVINDDRMAQGLPPMEKEEDEKVLVWPDLVYTELICMIVITVALVIWGVMLPAPLEQPASGTKTPNPSKAPWYFLGLQEMLVYYDPWIAGVVLPTIIIIGLIVLPYIDFNQKGAGYFTFAQRSFAIINFQFGFILLWLTMIFLMTVMRGPNQNFFGLYETWSPYKVVPLNNVNLSDYFWIQMLGTVWEQPRDGVSWGVILMRELPGIVLVLGYLLFLPPLLAKTIFRDFFIRMGFVRYFILVNLILFMASLPIKMVLRWTINLKYIVAIPEYFFNI